MPKGRRLAAHIFEDKHGQRLIVRRNGRRVERRYKHSERKTLGWLKNQVEIEIAKLEKKGPRGGIGTLAGDVAAFLKTLPEGRPKDDMDYWLQPWLADLGKYPREKITSQMVRETMAGWRVGKKEQQRAPGVSTLNHRKHGLKALYKALDGPHAPTPCDDIKRAKERKEIRVVPRGVVLAVLRQLPPCATTARLKVLARTGWPHTQIAKLQPNDINFKERLVRVTGRRKGGGTRDFLIPITADAARALRLMDRFDAWGTFSRHSMHKTFRLAVEKAKEKWDGPWPAPANLHPYDLRHAFITRALERSGGNLLGVSQLALHSDVSMTAFYAGAAASLMALSVRDAMNRKMPTGNANLTLQDPTKQAGNVESLSGQKVGSSGARATKKR